MEVHCEELALLESLVGGLAGLTWLGVVRGWPVQRHDMHIVHNHVW
jgi:hypothetical protein